MDEAAIIKAYNTGIESVISLVKDINATFAERFDKLNNEINKLNGRITELEAQLNKNSSNSGKPPSSDGYKKPVNSREKTGKPTGGQWGHEGKTLEKVVNPDDVIGHKIPEMCGCGCNLGQVDGTKKTRQVFDIPKPKIRVTEHVTYEKACPDCGMVHKSKFPVNVTQPVQYGENMQVLMNYLTQWLHVASTERLTYYEVHEKRGEKAALDIGILPGFTGTAVHDHWKPYYRFVDCTHAECNAHHLRSLKDVVENYHQ